MAGLTFRFCHVQHVRQVQDVGIQVHAVQPVRNIAGKVGEIRIPYIFLDLDVLQRKRFDLAVYAL